MAMLSLAAWPCLAKISIRYERPTSAKYEELYRALKSNHKEILGESAKYLNRLYRWEADVKVVVTTCGYVNSRFQPPGTVVICYESLYQKVYDYSEKANSKEAYVQRVFQNTMFTFWHEIGHAMIHQVGFGENLEVRQLEGYADEFAILSLLWREGAKWKDVVMISALHFKQKASLAEKAYKDHPDDHRRYEKMIALRYGFSQKSYSRLSAEVSQIQWLTQSPQAYYLERSAYWEKILREHTRRDFFDN